MSPSDNGRHVAYSIICHGDSVVMFTSTDTARDTAQSPLTRIPLEIHLEASIRDHYHPGPGEVLIAITEPGRPPITPRGSFMATHHLAAWDIPFTLQHPQYGAMTPLSMQEATSLLDFVLHHRHTMTKVVIYCKAGTARSPGVAIALSEWLPTTPHIYELIERHPCFHRPIYRTLCSAAIASGLLRT